MSQSGRCGAAGFTLIELVVVVGLIGVAILIAFMSLGNWRGDTAFSEMMQNLRSELRTLRTRAIMLQTNVGLVVVNVKASDLATNAIYLKLDPNKSYSYGSDHYFMLSRTTEDTLNDTNNKTSQNPQRRNSDGSIDTTDTTRRLFLFVNADKYTVSLNDGPSLKEVWFNPRGYATKSMGSAEKITYSLKVTPDASVTKMAPLTLTMNSLGVVQH